MGLSFKEFHEKEVGLISKRRAKYNRRIIVNITLISLFSVLIVLTSYFKIDFFDKGPLFIVLWFVILLSYISVLFYAAKIKDMRLTLKEILLYSFSEGMYNLEIFIQKQESVELKKSRKHIRRIVSELSTFESSYAGFKQQKDLGDSLSRLPIFITNDVLPILDWGLNKKDYNNLLKQLGEIFIMIQDENFEDMKPILEKHTDKYVEITSETFKSLMKQIHSSNILLTIFILFIILLLDLIGAVIFYYIGWKYNHYAGLILLIAFFAGLQPAMTFMRGILKNFTVGDKVKKKK